MESRRLLALYAHPDDEILGPGGAIALYASQGAQVELVVATRGEAGEIADPALATPETLPQVREQELRCSAETLGIRQVTFLGYRDSGMAGTAENQDPRAYMNSDPDEVVPRLVEIIRRLQPQVILTFEPFGGYGHPDHQTIHKHALLAVTAAADPDCRPDLGQAWDTPRLFYPLVRRPTWLAMKERMAARGLDVSFFVGLEERREQGWPDDQFHVTLDVSAAMGQKLAAFRCHATQFGAESIFRQLPEEEMAEILRYEYFALARPTPPPGLHLTDLFAGWEAAPAA
ncbi:MAG: PIG-L family deacetylase [Ardenticatenaceae bacterium]|nr:PIG-L family deacetylase [Ardenticatenaceae bacterium]MCB8986145.1 PIG-L family deacetylase [Ardenticatenaceae bacterium]